MVNQRDVYRVDLESNPCTVEARFGERAVRGLGVDLSAKGLGATFPCEPPELLPLVGELGQVFIAGDWLKRELRFEARAVRRSDIGIDICSFGFEFTAELDEVDPELRRLFNRRQAVRVRPLANDPVEVGISIRPSDQEAAVLRDISSSGIGIELDVMAQRSIGGASKLDLLLPLGPGGGVVVVPAAIRHRRYIGSSKIVVGLIFLLEQASPEVERAINDYVMILQREELSRAAQLRG
jgi:hypothetical protein